MLLTEAIKLVNHPRLTRQPVSTWADFGCGSGLFTNALSQLLPHGSKMYAVDINQHALSQVSIKNGIDLQIIPADFIHDQLIIEKLDGILMANSLHFVEHKEAFIQNIEQYCKPGSQMLFVEYDINKGNRWVPYPESFLSLSRLFTKLHYTVIEKINEIPSRYQRGNMYSVLIKK